MSSLTSAAKELEMAALAARHR